MGIKVCRNLERGSKELGPSQINTHLTNSKLKSYVEQ